MERIFFSETGWREIFTTSYSDEIPFVWMERDKSPGKGKEAYALYMLYILMD